MGEGRGLGAEEKFFLRSPCFVSEQVLMIWVTILSSFCNKEVNCGETVSEIPTFPVEHERQ